MGKPSITITEYERLSVGPRRNLSKKTLSYEDSSKLSFLSINGDAIFTESKGKLIAKQWVGVVDLPDLSVEILPKTADLDSPQQSRTILLKMLKVAYGNSFSKELAIAGSVATDQFGLKESVIVWFIESFQRYADIGVTRSYQKKNMKRPFIKGRLLIGKTIGNQRSECPTMFNCRFSIFTEDNPINRVLKLCIRKMLGDTVLNTNKTQLSFFLDLLGGVGDIDLSSLGSERVVFTQLNQHAQESFSVALLYLNNQFATVSLGGVKMKMMLFDMNKLFELFVFKIAKRVWGPKAHYQYQKNYLLQGIDGQQSIQMRPDIVVENGKGVKVVIDTKWKIYDGIPFVADAYQMNAYATSIPGVKSIYLLYPLSKTSATKQTFKINLVSGDEKTINTQIVDLNQINNPSFAAKFGSLFPDIV